MLKSLAGPFAGVGFCPTGGVTPDNMKSYLSLPNVLCVGGSWLAPNEMIEAQDWAGIRNLAEAAVSLSQANA